MRAALIPPLGLENFALMSSFHLALALPELLQRQVYRSVYQRAAKNGDYVVLDNGVAEGRGPRPDALVTEGFKLGCKEIVLPDVMAASWGTADAVDAFLNNYSTLLNKMVVVQGQTFVELKALVDRWSVEHRIDVIGIPRHLLTTLNKSSIRIDLANHIEETYPGRFQLHLLGTNPAWLGEVKAAMKYTPFIRSVDSSLPFNYAIAGLALDKAKTTPIKRPSKYFQKDWSRIVQYNLVRDNIRTFMEWTGDAARETAPPSGLSELSAQ